MSFEIIARQKQEVVSGSHVSYYLQEITAPDGITIVVECEDCIEAVDMNFAIATVFKSLWRRCKLRQGLGKPGSTPLYEVEKVSYYSDRIVAQSIWRNSWHDSHLPHDTMFDPNITLTIMEPKRLNPYSFPIPALIKALTNIPDEQTIFLNLFSIARLRQMNSLASLQLKLAKSIQENAHEIEAKERALLKRTTHD